MNIVHDFGSFLLCRPKLLKENVTIWGNEGIGFALICKWLDYPIYNAGHRIPSYVLKHYLKFYIDVYIIFSLNEWYFLLKICFFTVKLVNK